MFLKVFSPYGKELYQKEKVSHGKFGFTTTEGGGYRACFKAEGDHQSGKAITVGIDWKTGVSTKDWESIARKEKIEVLFYMLTSTGLIVVDSIKYCLRVVVVVVVEL